MWFPGSSRRLLYVYVVVLILVLLQMVGAIRVFPGNAVANNVGFSRRNNKSKHHQDLFNKYFSGRRTFGPTSSNTTQTGFDESKRRVPSCPDPLHN